MQARNETEYQIFQHNWMQYTLLHAHKQNMPSFLSPNNNQNIFFNISMEWFVIAEANLHTKNKILNFWLVLRIFL